MGPVLVLVAVGAIAWMLLAVPVRRRQRQHAAMQDAIEEGDEIITAGGIHAVVREAAESELRVEVAPGVVVTLDRRAVAAVAEYLPPEAGAAALELPQDAEDASAEEE